MAAMPQLEEFSNAPGHPLQNAVAQQIALISALYFGRQDSVLAILGDSPQGTILKFKHNPTSFDPSYVVIKQGNDTFVTFAGTVNGPQWVTHLTGAIGVDCDWQDGITVHALHQFFSRKIRTNDLATVVPAPGPGERVLLSGHSYGGSVAQWIGNQLVHECGDPDRVQVLTVAAPKLMTAGYTGPAPSVFQRVCNPYDAVPHLPPALLSLARVNRTPIRMIKLKGFKWKHYGQRWELRHDGIMRATDSVENDWIKFPIPMAPFVPGESDYLLNHLIEGYSKRIRKVLPPEENLSERFRNLMVAMRALEDQDPPSVGPPPPPIGSITTPSEQDRRLFGGSGAIITNDDLSNLRAIASIGVGTSRFPRNIAGLFGGTGPMASGTWKISLIINNGKYGRSMSFYRKAGSGETPQQTAEAAVALAQKYSVLLGNNTLAPNIPFKNLGSPLIEFIRVTDAFEPRLGDLIVNRDGDLRFMGPRAGYPADVLTTALSMRMRGVSGTGDTAVVSHSNLMIVGQPDSCVSSGHYEGPSINIVTAAATQSWDAFARDFVAWLVTQGYGYIGINHKTADKVAANFGLSPEGLLQFDVTAHGFVTGDVVVLKSTDRPEFHRSARVIKITDNEIALAGKKYLDGTPMPTRGKVYKIRNANGTRVGDFFTYTAPMLGFQTPLQLQVRKKNPGRQFVAASFSKRPRRATL